MNERALILLIEDDQDDAFLLERALRKAGITNPIQFAEQISDAVCSLEAQRRSEQPVFVIINIGMFLSAGTVIIQWMREQPFLAKMPILAIGNSNREADVQRAYDLGANAYFAKTLDMNELAKLIKELQFLDRVLVWHKKEL